MYREVRRKDREISLKEAEKILMQELVGVLSTVGSDGQPYGVPLNYVYENQSIYFHCALEGHKIDNIRDNHKVCFTVYGDHKVVPDQFTTEYQSVVVYGDAVLVEGAEKEKALKMMIQKFSRGYEKEGNRYIERVKGKTAVIKIRIDHMTGKRRPPVY